MTRHPLEPRQLWRRALERANERQPDEQAVYLFTGDADTYVTTVFHVRSHSEPETLHKVEIHNYDDGHVEALCSCPSRHPCWHTALCLARCGYLLETDVAEPVAA